MKKVILYFQISLDGIVSDSDKWMSFSDDILTDAIDYYETLDTVIFGSTSYPFLSAYWQRAEQSSNSSPEREFAKKINDINKIVISRSPIELSWKNSQHLTFTDNQSFVTLIQDLKRQPGKNISVEGGIGMWRQFMQNNLIDELMFFVHPVIYGKGTKLFDDMSLQTTLNLKSSRAIDKGVVKLHYEKA
jgi:dihydrofolate reductase